MTNLSKDKFPPDYSEIPSILQFHVFRNNPLIFFCPSLYVTYYLDLLGEFSKRNKLYLLCKVCTSMTIERDRRFISHLSRRVKNEFPNIDLTVICNSPDECQMVSAMGIKTLFCNSNSFLDYKLFNILPRTEKKYDAVYNATFAPFKRHYLAGEIKNLALIGYENHEVPFDSAYFPDLPQAKHLNYSKEKGFTWLNPEDIVHILNGSRVGLCLSAVEGAMFACIEYLLCGLPVVSTKSLGGRAVFFEKDYVRIVEDDPTAVAKAVDDLIQSNISPYYIREKTLEKIRHHREKFNQFILDICSKEQVKPERVDGWYGKYVNKLVSVYDLEKIGTTLAYLDKNPFEILPWNGYRSAVSVTFGGGDIGHYLDFVVPELDKRDLNGTFYLVAANIYDLERWKKAVGQGHEIGNYSMDFIPAGRLGEKDARYQVANAKETLQKAFGTKVLSYCYPMMETSPELRKWVEKENVAAVGLWNNQTVLTNDLQPDWFEFPSLSLNEGCSYGFFEDHLDKITTELGWLILSFNSIEGAGWGWKPLERGVFIQVLDSLSKEKPDVWVAPFATIASYWKAQKVMEGPVRIERKTDRIVYSWEKPDVFPDNIRLKMRTRNNVSKVLQNGKELSKDALGHFTLSFDEREMTLLLSY